MSSSFMASKRFKSVLDFFEVDDFLIPGRLPDRYDSDYLIGFRMSNGYNPAIERAECEKAHLVVFKPIIQKRDRLTREDLLNFRKINSVLANVGLSLGFNPLKSHVPTVVTNRSYVKAGSPTGKCYSFGQHESARV